MINEGHLGQIVQYGCSPLTSYESIKNGHYHVAKIRLLGGVRLNSLGMVYFML